MITVAQVGIGVWGQNHLRAFSNIDPKECRLKICCDKNKAVLDKLNFIYGGNLKITTRFEDILKDKEVDAVVIATPPLTHAQLSIEALTCGKHVFVEKPLALNVKDGQRMLIAAKKAKRKLMVGHLLLYHPAVNAIKRYIKEGVLGDVFYTYSTRVNLGTVRRDENALWNLTVHDISVASYLLENEPTEVTARGESYLNPRIHDIVFVTLKFKNNVISHIHASWLDPHKIRKLTVVGSKKMVTFDDMAGAEKVRLYDKGVDRKITSSTYQDFLTLREGDVSIPHINMIEPLKIECQHFIDCIKEDKEPMTNGENGLAVLKVLSAAQRSLEEGGMPVKIN